MTWMADVELPQEPRLEVVRVKQNKQYWRLSKTLARKLDFRPIEDEDVKYAWAAYKKGCLASMGFQDTNLSAEEFKTTFTAEVSTTYHGAWTLFAETRRGYMPVGMVLGFYSHPDPQRAVFMIVGDMLWMPWASKRNKIESAVNFFNKMRSQIPMVEYANEQHKRFFEMIAKHGIIRRVGTMFNVYRGEPCAVFETRAP